MNTAEPGRSVPARAAVLAAALAVAAACTNPPTQQPTEPDHGVDYARLAATPGTSANAAAAGAQSELAELRRATSRFHRPEEAAEAGYTVLVTHPTSGATCLEDPAEGGMGRHMLNPDLVDDVVVVSQPEVVIYEPMQNGKLRLVAVEYIIPYSIRGPDQPPPTLFGREFLHNPTFGLWMLHAYVWKHNPAGTFATWNPTISCEHDETVG